MNKDCNATLIDLGDAVVETKGSQLGKTDVGAGERPIMEGLSADD